MSKIRSNNSRQSISSRLPSLSPHTTAWFSVDSSTNKILELERHPSPKSLCHCPEPLLRHQNGIWTYWFLEWWLTVIIMSLATIHYAVTTYCISGAMKSAGQIYITSFHPFTNPEKLAQYRRFATSWILISAPPGNTGHWKSIHTDFRPSFWQHCA